MAIIVSSISPSITKKIGGNEIIVNGTFPQNENLLVFLGPLGTINDIPCYSGISGSSYDIISINGTEIKVITPSCNIGNMYLTVALKSNLSDNDSISITIIESSWRSKVIIFPKWYKISPSSIIEAFND